MMEKCQQTKVQNMYQSTSPSNDGLQKQMNDSDGDDSDCCIIGMYSVLDPNDPVQFTNNSDPIESLSVLPTSNCDDHNHQANDQDNEIFEENNNDPNNNLEDVQFTEELANNGLDPRERTVEVPLMNYRTKITSPQPGCSRDFSDTTNITYNIQHEATQIYNLLPKLKYSIIYNSLYQNRHAINRIELTLWDLLPRKRPNPQLSCKRRFEGDSYTVSCKKMFLEGNQCQIIQNNQDHVFCGNECLNQQEQSMSNVENDPLPLCKSYSTSSTSVKRNGILRQPKLILNTNLSLSSITPVTVKQPILTLPKFTFIRTNEESHTSVNTLKSCSNKDEISCDKADNMQCTSTHHALVNVTDVKGIELKDNEGFNLQSNFIRNNGDTGDNIEMIESALSLNGFIPTSINNVEQLSEDRNENDSEDKNVDGPTNFHEDDTLESVSSSDSSEDDDTSDTGETTENSCDNKFSNSTASNFYKQLTSLFPHVDPDYIHTICKDLPEDSNEEKYKLADQYEVLYALIEHLLSHGKDYPIKPKFEPENEEVNTEVNEQYTNLLGIFPDADPSYLRDIAEKVYNKQDELRDFVQSKLETHDYPTREQYIAKRKITEQQKQYTTDFNVEQFLQIFPDPVSYFEDEKRKNTFKPVAFEFLKHWFSKHKVYTLMSVYARCKYHLTLTVASLEAVQPDMKTKRYTTLLPTEDIPLLQEIAFIKHRSKIIEYLNDVENREAKTFKKLKDKGKLWKCECCYDDECMPSRCSSCPNEHVFCNSCIKGGTESKIADGETRVPCFVNCGSEFSLSVLQRVLSPTQFSILLQKRQEAEVMAAGLEGLVFCPFCHFASIPPPEDKVFKCFNPECMKESCRLCKKLNHVPLKCQEAACENARHYLEEKMTAALVRKCYRCKRSFFKEEGCNKMTCVCGAVMCYICDKPINDYTHFTEGAATSNLCPLWSDNKMINAQAVVRVAEAVDEEIRQLNPNIKLNTEALLPQLPPKQSNNH